MAADPKFIQSMQDRRLAVEKEIILNCDSCTAPNGMCASHSRYTMPMWRDLKMVPQFEDDMLTGYYPEGDHADVIVSAWCHNCGQLKSECICHLDDEEP